MTQQCPTCKELDTVENFTTGQHFCGTGVVEQTEERQVSAIHIGNVETGIILNWTDGTTEMLPMTKECYEDRKGRAEELHMLSHRQGQTEALEGLKNKLAFRFSKSGEYSSREEAKRGWDGHQARMVFEIDEELARLRSQGGE